MFFLQSSATILGGTPVFAGTQVPMNRLFEYLESGHSIGEFLDDFPAVSRDQVLAVLTLARDTIETRVQKPADEEFAQQFAVMQRLVEQMSAEHVARVRAWFIERDANEWDGRIERDVARGKLDGLIQESQSEYDAGDRREI